MSDHPNSSTANTTNIPQALDPTDKASVSNELEERLIDAEYKIWKKNTPYLYDFVMTHSLEWPSLTCQWLPKVKPVGGGGGTDSTAAAVEHSVLIGTHTAAGDQNYLMVASVNLPKGDAVVDNRQDDGDDGNDDGDGDGKKAAVDISASTAATYDEEKNEMGGFGNAAAGSSSAAIGKIEIRMKVKHEGEVNCARYMPQNHFVVASRGPDSDVYVWDLSKHSSFPDENSKPCPQVVCKGHLKEGYGVCWSPHKEGMLLTGSFDQTVCLWDVNAAISAKGSTSGTEVNPLSTFSGHTDFVEDVDWHHRDMNLVGSVGDDKAIMIWDVRNINPNKPVHRVEDAHTDDVNSIAFNPVNEYLLATGSADMTVGLWDMRNMKNPLQRFRGHSDQVYNVEWAPFNESILASCSTDRRVGIWDLSRIGMEQSPEDAEDGPPELLFLHGGHTSKVSDISWNMNDEWTISSVSEDNVLQVWNMAEEIYALDEDCYMVDADEDDGDDKEDEGGVQGKKAKIT